MKPPNPLRPPVPMPRNARPGGYPAPKSGFDWKRLLSPAGDALSDFGYGLATGGFDDAFGIAAQRGQDMQGYRDQQRQLQKSESEKVASRNASVAWIERKAAETGDKRYYDILAGLENNAIDPGGAFNAAMAISSEKPAAPKPPIEVNGQLVDPVTFEVLADLRTPEAPQQPDFPTSYDEFQLAQQNPDYAAALAAKNAGGQQTDAMRRATNLNSVVQDEALLLLGDGTPQNPGVFDTTRDSFDQILDMDVPVLGRVGRGFTEPDYQRAAAAIESIAQHYLYVQSGQAAPEGEVRRLAASVTPFPGEAKASIDEKRRRLETWVQAVETAAGQAPATQQPGTAPDIEQLLQKYQ